MTSISVNEIGGFPYITNTGSCVNMILIEDSTADNPYIKKVTSGSEALYEFHVKEFKEDSEASNFSLAKELCTAKNFIEDSDLIS